MHLLPQKALLAYPLKTKVRKVRLTKHLAFIPLEEELDSPIPYRIGGRAEVE
jgi:hypothetical protein